MSLGQLGPFEPMAVLRQSLLDLQAAQENLNRIYALAYNIYNRGMLTTQLRGQVHEMRDQVFLAESKMQRLVVAALKQSIAIQGAMLLGFPVAAFVPRPVKRANLPPANVGKPPVQPLPVPTQGMAVQMPDGTTNLQAAGLVIVLALITAAAVVAVFGIQELGVIARNGQRLAANTRNFLAELRATDARYVDCLERGGNLRECAGLFPVPEAPQEAPETEGFPWLAVFGGAAAVVGIGFLAQRYAPSEEE